MSLVSKIVGGIVDVGVRLLKGALRTKEPEQLDPAIKELESERIARELDKKRRERMERNRGR